MALAAYWRACPAKNIFTNFQQIRTTYVVKRRNEAWLTKPNRRPSLRQKHYVYDTVEDNIPKPARMMNILLRKYVEDVGKPGELVTVKETFGRLLIMTEKGAYPTAENWAKYGSQTEQISYSSKYVLSTMNRLAKLVLSVNMNKDNPWTLEPWHVRVAFRKAGWHVPESAITLPKHPISGPDMNIQNKEFYVVVTINGQEKQVVRCRIHHLANNPDEVIERGKFHEKFPAELIFPEDEHMAKDLPKLVPPELDENDLPVPVPAPKKK